MDEMNYLDKGKWPLSTQGDLDLFQQQMLDSYSHDHLSNKTNLNNQERALLEEIRRKTAHWPKPRE